jgi:hypothetical protein
VRDADGAGRRVAREFLDEIAELALGTAADQLAALDRAYARRVIAAIFHALQPVDEAVRDLGRADDSDNSAHVFLLSFKACKARESPAWPPENPLHSASRERDRG